MRCFGSTGGAGIVESCNGLTDRKDASDGRKSFGPRDLPHDYLTPYTLTADKKSPHRVISLLLTHDGFLQQTTDVTSRSRVIPTTFTRERQAGIESGNMQYLSMQCVSELQRKAFFTSLRPVSPTSSSDEGSLMFEFLFKYGRSLA